MKNIKMLMVFFAITGTTYAQDAVYKNDTLIYKSNKLYASKEIQLLYGSLPNKFFAYVFLKKEDNSAPSTLSKQRCVISLIKEKHGKYYALAKLYKAPWPYSKNVLIDIEGAIDLNEIKLDDK